MGKLYFNIIAIVAIFFFTACQKAQTLAPTSTNTTTGTTTIIPVAGRTIAIGTGTGNLIIDGTTLGLKCNDTIKVKGGTYNGIDVQNINAGCPIYINNDGLVQMAGNSDHMHITNVSNLTISGDGTTGIAQGFISRDNAYYHSIILNGASHNLTIQNFSFSNIGNIVIYSTGTNIYNGTKASYTDSLKILNNTCTNTSTFIQFGGDVIAGIITGLIKNMEISGLNFSNSNCGVVVFAANADSYNIHNNIITDINQTNNNHNGIFMIKGSGSFHHNLVKNHQGNAIRAWIRSFGTVPQTVLIYNNVVVNSRKYSAFEVQSFAAELAPGVTTYANAKIYDNTCGNLNLSKDWIGVIVDVYDLFGGTCDVYDNVGFNFPAPNPNSFFVNEQASTVPTVSNNIYFTTATAAGITNVNTLTVK
ncbi:hypothetical protein [Mucilaginibacter polytrichastri]|uniref:Right handed beta helix domain-containing protein n=1 Tax=Mucilaginibacter polytrichastri TaxID=1302689 RepID=A0A1Q5ZYP0_9SPHI|nr:hypothetical protein [Mucilaginibacter polytrichastri]OKS86858.1 hypothetical protein RG47T_2316 [Mucilaginibacter polytrichastri]SFT17504.1 hypothetical protein SAMN04487890_11441 [Mucilaginibacter polytrichastri]